MEERIAFENLDSEFCNFGDNIYDPNNVTICITNAIVGTPAEDPKRIKKYEILNPLPDKKLEKKRQDAIKSKNNRDKVKNNQKVTEKALAKCQVLIKNFENELQLQKANHGKEIAELKMEIALRDKTISDLQHRAEFDEFRAKPLMFLPKIKIY